MPYRLTYTATLEYIAPGAGPMAVGAQQSIKFTSGAVAPGGIISANPQGAGGPSSNTFLAADIVALTAAMQADISAQLTAFQPTATAWASGATVSTGSGPAGGNL